jgi:hypothetical protein
VADLVQGAVRLGQAKAQPDNAGLPLGQRGQDRSQDALELGKGHRVERDHGLEVLDELAEPVVALVAEGLV